MKELAFEFDQSSFSDRVYTAILEQLINHRIKPGEKLSEEDIASALQVSRTPVREALKRLASDGLVDFYPRRGAYAKEITHRDITELYELRRCVEIHAAKLAMGNIPKNHLRRINLLIENCHLAEDDDFIEAELQLDRDIHKAINIYCGNSRLKEMLEKLDHLARFMRILQLNRKERAKDNFTEHEKFWKALVAEEKKLMVQCLKEHLDNRKNYLLEHFQEIHDKKEAALQ